MEFSGAKVTILNVKKNGIVDLDILKKHNKKTLMVSIMIANNETGNTTCRKLEKYVEKME